jgi:hypothetical protein
MAHSQYHHFPSQVEGAKTMVLPAGDHDRIGCFTDQVKLTRALVRDLDEAVKDVKLLGEHEEESSQKITELEALCKRLKEDAQKLKEEKATLEGMVKSHDELIMEIAKETRLDRMGEDAEDEDEEDEDADDKECSQFLIITSCIASPAARGVAWPARGRVPSLRPLLGVTPSDRCCSTAAPLVCSSVSISLL